MCILKSRGLDINKGSLEVIIFQCDNDFSYKSFIIFSSKIASWHKFFSINDARFLIVRSFGTEEVITASFAF